MRLNITVIVMSEMHQTKYAWVGGRNPNDARNLPRASQYHRSFFEPYLTAFLPVAARMTPALPCLDADARASLESPWVDESYSGLLNSARAVFDALVDFGVLGKEMP